ncbi:TniB family NTP-binding protein [Dyella caseinilytica]|uniref:TniB family NTP-binding protein n=1 Tax=Dyella caseinilytica TaxID=1849581 RepID=A0ABX7GZ37_9GAMM|nr:TniB family NTP-binding protein [Dyella caseinilytica]QRN55590.1 TniB family NTP-binding protein [Dyella caseinilytica]GGA02890.1 transposition protein TniB [Dyella caseinilytica]
MRAAAADLPHLTTHAKKIALLPDSERIQHIRSDRWIGYTKALHILERLDDLLAWPPKQRMPNMLLIGPTNNGKSMIIERFRRKNHVVHKRYSAIEKLPVVALQMPSDPTISRFYSMLLFELGAPPAYPRARIAELELSAIKLLEAVGAKMLIIDEIHNILAGQRNHRLEFLNLLRYLGNSLRIPIVGVGIQEAHLAIRSDPQLENRFEPIPLPRWVQGEELQSLLASFAASLPLKQPSNLQQVDMAQYLLERSEGTIGEIARLLSAAAETAISTGEESINRKTLLQTPYESPSDRRRAFERVL